MKTMSRVAEEVQRFLGLAHRPVGIQIEEGPRQKEPSGALLRFCILEREDLSDGARVIRYGDVECPGASLALGMVAPVRVDVEPRIHAPVSSVRVGPLEDADQVLLVVTPRQAMTLAIVTGGIEARCEGTHAVCGEVIARVHETGRPHLSLLCGGMRDLCGFRDEELVVGLAWDDFITLPDRMDSHPSLRVGAEAEDDG